MKKQKSKAKPRNLLLKSLGGKSVNIMFKAVKNGIPMISGILLDEDEQNYYLGESFEISVAVRKIETSMILNAEIPMTAIDDDDVPKGTKIQ
jgi:hypothetical protein